VSSVATAALVVATGLLVLAAAACIIQMTPVKDARLRRLARLYLEPLSVWCAAAVIVHILAVVAAGDVDALALMLPIGVGIAALLLRWADEPHAAPPAEAPPGTAAPAHAAPPGTAAPAHAAPRAPAPTRAASGSLWSRS
jgi:hypothetical protein